MIKIICEEAPILAENFKRTFNNLTRVDNLINTYEKTKEKDILRICIVYIHATIEDCMRNILYYRLQITNDSSLLNSIGFYNEILNRRIEKFQLGDLLKYKNITIDDFIKKSINQYVEYQTYNNTTDIARVFNQFKIPLEPISDILPQLDKIIKRRHDIVHNSDLETDRPAQNISAIVLNEGIAELTDIDLPLIKDSQNACSKFVMYTIKAFLPEGVKIILQNA